jgi:predicted CoA-binding protein
MTTITDPQRALLTHCHTIAVVGLSPKPWRVSFDVARAMQAMGYRIIPINPNAGVQSILGERVYSTLTEAAAHAPIELVNIFRHSDDVPPVVDEAIAIGARGIWMQLGIAHPDAAARAETAGLHVVQNACIKIECARLR